MATPKIQATDPTIEDHSIFFSEIGLRIPLSLWRLLSYLPTSKPSLSDMTNLEDVYVLTKSRCDPHQTYFAENEENMLDWEENLIDCPNRQQILLADIEEDDTMVASAYVRSVKVKAVNVDLRSSTSNNDLQ